MQTYKKLVFHCFFVTALLSTIFFFWLGNYKTSIIDDVFETGMYISLFTISSFFFNMP